MLVDVRTLTILIPSLIQRSRTFMTDMDGLSQAFCWLKFGLFLASVSRHVMPYSPSCRTITF